MNGCDDSYDEHVPSQRKVAYPDLNSIGSEPISTHCTLIHAVFISLTMCAPFISFVKISIKTLQFTENILFKII
jgi:hypothetical protein